MAHRRQPARRGGRRRDRRDRRGKELALVELPIAGLMSDERAEIVAGKARRMVDAMRACGCTLNNAFMQHSLLALVSSPSCASPISA